MNSPAPNVAYLLTVAKVKTSELPTDYGPLGPVKPTKAAFKGMRKGKAPMKKRKYGDIDDDKDNGEEEMDGANMDDDEGSPC